MQVKIPPYIKKGDTIGVVAPAGYMAIEKMETCIATLESWGYNVQMGQTTHSDSSNYFSGTDEERLNDLQLMLDDKNIKAVFCARGGYGISRIVDRISFKKFKKTPKWVIGFSDVTVLLSHIFSQCKTASLHAPMAAAFNDGEFNNQYILSLKAALEGIAGNYDHTPHEFNKEGEASGILVGGNLSLLCHLLGTASDINTKNKILFLEDIGEYLYNVDRMMLQLKRAGKFDKLAGLIIGRFTDSKDTDRPFGKTVDEIIHEQIKEVNVPICFNFPVSHEKENLALKVGVEYSLSIDPTSVSLDEKVPQ